MFRVKGFGSFGGIQGILVVLDLSFNRETTRRVYVKVLVSVWRALER